jgi:hypothetical protein
MIDADDKYGLCSFVYTKGNTMVTIYEVSVLETLTHVLRD